MQVKIVMLTILLSIVYLLERKNVVTSLLLHKWWCAAGICVLSNLISTAIYVNNQSGSEEYEKYHNSDKT